MEDLISIIIPAYNAEGCIEKCLDSVLKQTYHKIEVLVVDDGSKDRTGELCDRYQVADKRVQVFHVENGGVSWARNIGIEKASGKYIMFVDSDDYVSEKYVEKHYQIIQQGDADLGITGYYICYPQKKEENQIKADYIGVYEIDNLGQAFSWLYKNYFLNSPWNKIYKKCLIFSGFCTEMSLGEDLYFNLGYMEHVSRVSIGGDCCYYYMCDPEKDSLTRRISRKNFQSEAANFCSVLSWYRKLSMEDITEIQLMYVQNMIAMLFTMARKKLSGNEKRQIIKELCESETIQETVKSVKTTSWKSEILRWLLCNQCSAGIYLLLEAVRLFG